MKKVEEAKFKALIQYGVNLLVSEQHRDRSDDVDDEDTEQHLDRLQHLKVHVRHTLDRLVLELRRKHETVHEMLNDLDCNSDGRLDRSELCAGLDQIGLSLSSSELDSVMAHFDRNCDGKVNLEELRAVLTNHRADLALQLKGINDTLTFAQCTNEQIRHVLEADGVDLHPEGAEPIEKERSWLVRLFKPDIDTYYWDNTRSCLVQEDNTRKYPWRMVAETIESLQKQEVLTLPILTWDEESEDPIEALACSRVGDLFVDYEVQYWW